MSGTHYMHLSVSYTVNTYTHIHTTREGDWVRRADIVELRGQLMSEEAY